MRNGFLTAFAFTFLCIPMVSANEIAERAFFQSVAGEWTGEGILTNAEGEETKVVEEWEAGPVDSGGFEFSGTRQWGDESSEFRWTFSFNVATESIESEYWHTGMEDPLRFEVSLTDDRVEMISNGDGGNSEVRVVNTLKDDKMTGVVSVKNGDGIEVLGGEVIHSKTREKERQ